MSKHNQWTRTRALLNQILGFLLILLGLILIFPGVPGPGLLLIIAGLAILARYYFWARKLLDKSKEAATKATDKIKKKP